MRMGCFAADDEPLDDGGLRKVEGIKEALGTFELAFASPSAAAGQTAAALGLKATADARLRDIAFGPWVGLDIEQAQARDPAAFIDWLGAPEEGVPGGESMADVRLRIADWLAEQAASARSVIAVTHPMVIRAGLAAALDLPLASVMRFDVAPLSPTTLSHNRIWRLQSMGR